MTSNRWRAKRVVYLGLVREFAAAAREHASAVPAGTADWHFYRGVQAAASDVLHTDVAEVRSSDSAWLDAEDPAFRDGYHTASTMLSSVAVAPERHRRIMLPVLQRHMSSG